MFVSDEGGTRLRPVRPDAAPLLSSSSALAGRGILADCGRPKAPEDAGRTLGGAAATSHSI